MWSDAARAAAAAAREAAAKGVQSMQAGVAAAHQTGVYQALNKDRFTGMVPPGSKRDFAVKQAALWSKAGLEKAAIMAAGGGVAGVAGMAVANYTKWGGDMARQFGPRVKQKIQALRH